jgi:hypothetical protein
MDTIPQVFEKLEAIHNDVQTRFHDQWDWMNAGFYVEALKTHMDIKQERIEKLEALLREIIADYDERNRVWPKSLAPTLCVIENARKALEAK